MKDLKDIITIEYWKTLFTEKSPETTTLHYDFTPSKQMNELKKKAIKKKKTMSNYTLFFLFLITNYFVV